MIPLALLLAALALGGCAAVGGFLVTAGVLVACGPMPMSPDDCRPKRSPPAMP